jgi:NodT family efflux transporter outer membrane factor (OMF) lipoprotein
MVLRIPPRMIGAAALAGLSACAVGPSFHRPAAPAATDYGSAPAPGSTTASAPGTGGAAQQLVANLDIPGQWWTLFRSEDLTRLVEQSLKGNPNMDAAKAAVRQAHELYNAQRTSYFPLVQGGFDASRQKYPVSSLTAPTTAISSTYNLYTAQLSLSYMPDVFGGTRRSVEAARAGLEATRFELIATYVTLSSNVVTTAVQEASLRGQIAATERMLALQHELTETLKRQQGIGTASNVDLLPQQALEAQTAATLPPLRKQLGQTRDALTALLGKLPSAEPAETFRLEELTLPTQLPVSLPSKLVEQRPDVRQAEENMHAASAEVGVAVANMLPQFNITADLGTTALQAGQLFGPYTGFWDLGASLTQTLFDAGALIYRHKAAEAGLDQAGALYRAAVILAFQNVADTLKALQADADTLKATEEADRAARAAWELARRQYQLGTLTLVALMNAEVTYQQAQLALVQAQANRYADTAALFQALGGGWWNLPGATFTGATSK